MKGDLHWSPQYTITVQSDLGGWLREEILHNSSLPKKYLEQAVAIAANGLRGDLFSATGRVSYARRPESYAAPSPYPRPFVTYAAMKQCIDALEQAGLIHSDKSQPWPNGKGRQSVFMVTSRFAMEAYKHDLVGALELIDRPDRSLVIVRDRNTKKMLPWPVPEEGRRLSQTMEEINAFLAPVWIRIPKRSIVGQNHDGTILAISNPRAPNRAPVLLAPNVRKALYLPFLDNFGLGGRPSGWDAQNLPSAVRSECKIWGEPVCDVDISASHIALAYTSVGRAPPQEDPYGAICDRTGVGRKLAKHSALIMLNAANVQEATGAIAKEILEEREIARDPEAQRAATAEAFEIVKAFRKVHRHIAALTCSDFGVRAQNLEARIMIRTMLSAKANGIPLIPMHDGVCGPRNRAEHMIDKLAQAWSAETGQTPPKITLEGEEARRKERNDPPHVWNDFSERR